MPEPSFLDMTVYATFRMSAVTPQINFSTSPNAAPQPRLEAGAERTLEGVGCMPMFGGWLPLQSGAMTWFAGPPWLKQQIAHRAGT
jgi:hypothetical protein